LHRKQIIISFNLDKYNKKALHFVHPNDYAYVKMSNLNIKIKVTWFLIEEFSLALFFSRENKT